MILYIQNLKDSTKKEKLLELINKSRQKDWPKVMDNFMAQMEAKYWKSSKQGGRKTALKKENN